MLQVDSNWPSLVRPVLSRRALLPLALALSATSPACVFVPPPPLPEELAAIAQDAAEAGEAPIKAAPRSFRKGQEAPTGLNDDERLAYNRAQGDPAADGFSLEEALAGLAGKGKLWAQFQTSKGEMHCELLEGLTPITVANFVGLARGLRPSREAQPEGEWRKIRYYDNSQFHRVIPKFMIQGGDPTASGSGGPGFVIPDEIVPSVRFDRPGLLAMANRGPGTGGAQFFVTLGPTSHLNGAHTIFGRCTPQSAVIAAEIAAVQRDSSDRPATPVRLEKVEIYRADDPRTGASLTGTPAAPDSSSSAASDSSSASQKDLPTKEK